MRNIQTVPTSFSRVDFSPDRLLPLPQGFVYLDLDSKRLARVLPEGILYSAGFGEQEDALFDPSDLVPYNLSLFILDRSENRLIQLDQRLNFIGEMATRTRNQNRLLYPDQVAVDSRGYFLLYSSEFHSVWRGNWGEPEFDPFIDLDQETGSPVCVKEVSVNKRGELALLFPCKSLFRLYSPLGRRLRSVRIEISHPEFLLPLEERWVVLNREGEGQVWDAGVTETFQLNTASQRIVDATVDRGTLYLLFDDHVLKVDDRE